MSSSIRDDYDRIAESHDKAEKERLEDLLTKTGDAFLKLEAQINTAQENADYASEDPVDSLARSHSLIHSIATSNVRNRLGLIMHEQGLKLGAPLDIKEKEDEEELQNWYEIPIELPEKYKDWATKNVAEDDIKDIPEPHITLLYGFDPAHYKEIDGIVKSHNITAADYTFGEVKAGEVSPVVLLPVVSDKLQTIFWELHGKFPNQHTLIDGKFPPHVTLCTVTGDKPPNLATLKYKKELREDTAVHYVTGHNVDKVATLKRKLHRIADELIGEIENSSEPTRHKRRYVATGLTNLELAKNALCAMLMTK